MSENSTPVAAPALPRLGDALMLSDTPVMAGVITAMAQPFAQLREALGWLPDWAPLLVAALSSVLVAVYHVHFRRHSQGAEAWLLTALVTLILFSAAVGANNVVDAARRGAGQGVQVAAEAQELETLRGQLKLVQAQLDNERRLKDLLLRELGVASPSTGGAPPPKTGMGFGPALAGISGWFVAEARAQQNETPEERKKRLEEALKQYEAEQRKLREEEERLRQEAQRQQQPQQQSTPLWKSW